MSNTRIGIVGAGAVAQRHVAVLGGFGDVEVVGVVDPLPAAAQVIAEATGAPVYPGLRELLDDTGPDAAYVCVPPFAHGEPELLLAERGIPFFVEKPLAAELAVAEEIAEAVAERALVTATGYHWRYLDGVVRARELLQETPARLAIGSWLDKVPPPAWWIRRDRSGGQVVEQATHVLDTMLVLLGDVEHLYAVASHAPRTAFPDADVDDVTTASLRFATGAVGSLSATSLLHAKHRAGLELFCEGRRLELDETVLVVDDGAGPKIEATDHGEAKQRVDRAFIDAVQGHGDDVRAPYAVALSSHRLSCAIARSARDRVPLDVIGAR